jgi:hypothetical protein
MDALKGNESVTSLDLSNNKISDDGAINIATVLAMNGVPELIELDLRGNPFTNTGLTSLVSSTFPYIASRLVALALPHYVWRANQKIGRAPPARHQPR